MHYTSPAHPQEKKQEYQIDNLQRLVLVIIVVAVLVLLLFGIARNHLTLHLSTPSLNLAEYSALVHQIHSVLGEPCA